MGKRAVLPDPAELLSAIFRGLPSTSCFFPDFNICRAMGSGSVTKPKPRDLPVSLSVGMWHSKTLSRPHIAAKKSKSVDGAVEYAKLPI